MRAGAGGGERGQEVEEGAGPSCSRCRSPAPPRPPTGAPEAGLEAEGAQASPSGRQQQVRALGPPHAWSSWWLALPPPQGGRRAGRLASCPPLHAPPPAQQVGSQLSQAERAFLGELNDDLERINNRFMEKEEEAVIRLQASARGGAGGREG